MANSFKVSKDEYINKELNQLKNTIGNKLLYNNYAKALVIPLVGKKTDTKIDIINDRKEVILHLIIDCELYKKYHGKIKDINRQRKTRNM